MEHNTCVGATVNNPDNTSWCNSGVEYLHDTQEVRGSIPRTKTMAVTLNGEARLS